MLQESRCTSRERAISSTSHHASPATIAIAAASGVLIALQSRANGQLSLTLGNPLEAACISFGSGFILLLMFSLLSARLREGLRRIPAAVRERGLPWWHTFGGMLGATFVIVQSYAVPLIGIAVFSVATIGGQTAMSMVVDLIGLRAGIRHRVTSRRLITGVITVLAVVVSVSDRLSMPASSLLVPVLGLLSGALIAIQRALNAHVNDYAQQSFATTWWNFITGCLLLFAAAVVLLLRGGDLDALPADTWWMYTGGAIGVVYIAIANVVAQRIGVLLLTALSVGGQLAASLALDLLTPAAAVTIGPHIYAGVILSLLGILVGTARWPNRASVALDNEEF